MLHSKPTIRKNILTIRSNISALDAQSAALKAAGNFIKFIKLQNIKTIALYYPINGEISPLPLLELIQSLDITFCLPVVKAKSSPLEFHAWRHGDPLINNRFYPQLLEPKLQQKHVIPDLIIVPMVAFDTALHRIGYGAGFYDRTLQEIRSQKLEVRGKKEVHNSLPPPHHLPLTIGYAFEIQKHSALIPADRHDMKLDHIITEKQIY